MRPLIVLMFMTFIFWTTGSQADTPSGANAPRMDELKQPMTFRPAQICGGSPRLCRDVVLARGVIQLNSLDDMRAALLKQPARRVVYFDSLGGNLGGALKMGLWLRERGYATAVGGHSSAVMVCASACPFAMMGGRARLVEEGAVIGWHQYSIADEGYVKMVGEEAESTIEVQRMAALLQTYVARMHINSAVMQMALATNPDDMYLMSAKEARAFNLDNSQPDEESWSLRGGDTDDSMSLVAQQQQPYSDTKMGFLISDMTGHTNIVFGMISVQAPYLSDSFDAARVRGKATSVRVCRGDVCVEGRVGTEWKTAPQDDRVLMMGFGFLAKDMTRLMAVRGLPVIVTWGLAGGGTAQGLFPGRGFDAGAKTWMAGMSAQGLIDASDTGAKSGLIITFGACHFRQKNLIHVEPAFGVDDALASA